MAQLPAQSQAKQLAKFSEVGRKKTYKQQAQFFLNAFWPEHKEHAEDCYVYVNKFSELDAKQHEDGVSLDEFESARFLESFGQAMTVLERRAALKEIDVDTDNKMSFLEYAVWKYKASIDELMARPQGTNEELEQAQAALTEVQKEIRKIEDKKASLEEKAKGDGVKAKSAKNELEQLLAADQMPLRKKVISAEAAVRIAQKKGNQQAQGALWWINRELEEAKKYKPRGGVKHF
jgi:chromosome segregation ATPase